MTASKKPNFRRFLSLWTCVLAGLAGSGPSHASDANIYAYVGTRTTKERNARGEGLSVYRVDARGHWTRVQLMSDLVNPSFLIVDSSQRHLYAVHGDRSEVSSFAIDAANGQLKFLNQQSTNGKNPVHLAIDPSHRFLLVANYATGSIASLPINADGSLAPVVALAAFPGEPGPHKTQQTSSHPHQIVFDSTGQFVISPDKGLDRVFSYRLNPTDGTLLPGPTPFVAGREGSGTRHIAFHPAGSFAYVMNELDSSVTTYSWKASEGALKPLQILPTAPANFTGNNTGAGIVIGNSGKFVYGSNRGHDSIAIYRVDQSQGTLASIGWQASGGKGPRFITIAPDGKTLYAANENSDTITQFRIDQANGSLTPFGEAIAVGSPVSIVFARY